MERKVKKKKPLRRVRVELPPDPVTGKRQQKSFYGHTLREANEKKDAFLASLKSVIDPVSFSDWLSMYVDTYFSPNLAACTRRMYMSRIRAIDAYFSGMKLADIRPIHVQRFANSLAGMSSGSVTHFRALLSNIMRQAVANGFLSADPSATVRWSSVGNKRPHRCLTRAEISAITNHWQEAPHGIAYMLMLWAGLRRGEAYGLRWSDIRDGKIFISGSWKIIDEDGQFGIGTTKTKNSIRAVPLLPLLSAALDTVPRVSDFVIGNMPDISTYTLDYEINKLNALVSRYVPDHDKITRHDLRHTFCSMLYEANVDIKTAQSLMGHSKPQITMEIYTHFSEERQNASLSNLVDLSTTYETK